MMRTAFAVAVMVASATPVFAQDCGTLRKGSYQWRTCLMNTPEYQAAYQACARLADDRGFWGPVIENPGVLRFFWGCMMEKHQYNPPVRVVKLYF